MPSQELLLVWLLWFVWLANAHPPLAIAHPPLAQWREDLEQPQAMDPPNAGGDPC